MRNSSLSTAPGRIIAPWPRTSSVKDIGPREEDGGSPCSSENQDRGATIPTLEGLGNSGFDSGLIVVEPLWSCRKLTHALPGQAHSGASALVAGAAWPCSALLSRLLE